MEKVVPGFDALYAPEDKPAPLPAPRTISLLTGGTIEVGRAVLDVVCSSLSSVPFLCAEIECALTGNISEKRVVVLAFDASASMNRHKPALQAHVDRLCMSVEDMNMEAYCLFFGSSASDPVRVGGGARPQISEFKHTGGTNFSSLFRKMGTLLSRILESDASTTFSILFFTDGQDTSHLDYHSVFSDCLKPIQSAYTMRTFFFEDTYTSSSYSTQIVSGLKRLGVPVIYVDEVGTLGDEIEVLSSDAMSSLTLQVAHPTTTGAAHALHCAASAGGDEGDVVVFRGVLPATWDVGALRNEGVHIVDVVQRHGISVAACVGEAVRVPLADAPIRTMWPFLHPAEQCTSERIVKEFKNTTRLPEMSDHHRRVVSMFESTMGASKGSGDNSRTVQVALRMHAVKMGSNKKARQARARWQACAGRAESALTAFHRDHLPHLLRALHCSGARCPFDDIITSEPIAEKPSVLYLRSAATETLGRIRSQVAAAACARGLTNAANAVAKPSHTDPLVLRTTASKMHDLGVTTINGLTDMALLVVDVGGDATQAQKKAASMLLHLLAGQALLGTPTSAGKLGPLVFATSAVQHMATISEWSFGSHACFPWVMNEYLREYMRSTDVNCGKTFAISNTHKVGDYIVADISTTKHPPSELPMEGRAYMSSGEEVGYRRGWRLALYSHNLSAPLDEGHRFDGNVCTLMIEHTCRGSTELVVSSAAQRWTHKRITSNKWWANIKSARPVVVLSGEDTQAAISASELTYASYVATALGGKTTSSLMDIVHAHVFATPMLACQLQLSTGVGQDGVLQGTGWLGLAATRLVQAVRDDEISRQNGVDALRRVLLLAELQTIKEWYRKCGNKEDIKSRLSACLSNYTTTRWRGPESPSAAALDAMRDAAGVAAGEEAARRTIWRSTALYPSKGVPASLFGECVSNILDENIGEEGGGGGCYAPRRLTPTRLACVERVVLALFDHKDIVPGADVLRRVWEACCSGASCGHPFTHPTMLFWAIEQHENAGCSSSSRSQRLEAVANMQWVSRSFIRNHLRAPDAHADLVKRRRRLVVERVIDHVVENPSQNRPLLTTALKLAFATRTWLPSHIQKVRTILGRCDGTDWAMQAWNGLPKDVITSNAFMEELWEPYFNNKVSEHALRLRMGRPGRTYAVPGSHSFHKKTKQVVQQAVAALANIDTAIVIQRGTSVAICKPSANSEVSKDVKRFFDHFCGMTNTTHLSFVARRKNAGELCADGSPVVWMLSHFGDGQRGGTPVEELYDMFYEEYKMKYTYLKLDSGAGLRRRKASGRSQRRVADACRTWVSS